MEKLTQRFLISLLLISASTAAQSLEILKSQKFEPKLRINSHRYGGISAISFSGDFLWAISDDRGQFGPPRLYKQTLKNNQVKIENELLVPEPSGSKVVDYEGLAGLKNGHFIISSEGDFNKKPRVLPFVKIWSESEKWMSEIVLPEDFFPEKLGLQTKGLHNNSGMEGVTISPDEKSLFVMSELPLFQNRSSGIELLEYEKSESKWTLKSRKTYERESPADKTFEVSRGVSEVLFWKAGYLLVLERWVRLSQTKALVIGAELFSVNISNLQKKKLFTFDGELAANWEGLTWGPDLSDGRKVLILVSDNNFERLTPTQYLFLAFKEEKP